MQGGLRDVCGPGPDGQRVYRKRGVLGKESSGGECSDYTEAWPFTGVWRVIVLVDCKWPGLGGVPEAGWDRAGGGRQLEKRAVCGLYREGGEGRVVSVGSVLRARWCPVRELGSAQPRNLGCRPRGCFWVGRWAFGGFGQEGNVTCFVI